MAIPELEGGRPPSRPTSTSGSDGSERARTASKASFARPSSSTTTSRTRQTIFDRLPAEDRAAAERSSLDQAVRDSERSTPTSNDRDDNGRSDEAPGRRTPGDRGARNEEAPGRRTPEQDPTQTGTVEERAASESEARRGRATDNDGRADKLRTGNHDGGRDEQIATLKARQEELRAEETQLEAEIDDVEAEIKSNERKVGVVGTVVDAATAPVSAVFGIFGRSNPIGDAAEAAAERALGLDEQRDELKAKEADLEKMQAEIEEEIERLEQERTLNFLADVAYVTNMPDPIADALEGAGSIEFRVVEETGLGSDAAYASDERAIVIDDAVIEKVNQNYEALRQAGIVDEDGRILDAAAFDEHEAGDAVISTTALIGVHEVTHGAQDQSNLIAQAAAAGTEILEDAQQLARRFGGEDAVAVVDAAHKRAEMNRIDMLEYDAYVNQETLELQAGKEKKGFITVNPDGSLLPREEAVENIYQFQLGQPLLHGTSAGEAFAGVVASQEAGGGDGETPGRYTPGEDAPGRYTPGRYTPGEDAPGRYTPGFLVPGLFAPGRYTPGDDTPGRYTPGRYTPGSDAPGRYTPGRYTPGSDAPGRYTPGDDTPGRYTPGRYTPGSDAPGRYTPGSETA